MFVLLRRRRSARHRRHLLHRPTRLAPKGQQSRSAGNWTGKRQRLRKLCLARPQQGQGKSPRSARHRRHLLHRPTRLAPKGQQSRSAGSLCQRRQALRAHARSFLGSIPSSLAKKSVFPSSLTRHSSSVTYCSSYRRAVANRSSSNCEPMPIGALACNFLHE